MDIQPSFNEYKVVTCMCQYFSKNEDQCWQTTKQTPKLASENNMRSHDNIKTIAKPYLTSPECSV